MNQEKIIAVLDKLIDNVSDVDEVYKDKTEFYFSCRGKYFSIFHRPSRSAGFGDYSFCIYPKISKINLSDLADLAGYGDMNSSDMLQFMSADFIGDGAPQMKQLFDLIAENRTYNQKFIDDFLDS